MIGSVAVDDIYLPTDLSIGQAGEERVVEGGWKSRAERVLNIMLLQTLLVFSTLFVPS